MEKMFKNTIKDLLMFNKVLFKINLVLYKNKKELKCVA
jgi:hypothetical protein